MTETDYKITDAGIPEHTSPEYNDLLYIVKDVLTTPASSKIDLAALLKHTLGYADQVAYETLSETRNLVDSDPCVLILDPDGEDRSVVLPTEAASNHAFVIINDGADAEKLNVYDYALSWHYGAILPQKVMILVSNGVFYWELAPQVMSLEQEVLNDSGGNIASGDVVVFDTTADLGVAHTTAIGDTRVLGVAAGGITDGLGGFVHTVPGSIVAVNCTAAAVSRGQFLVTSATAGKAQAAGYVRGPGTFAVALTAKDGSGVGTVQALLINDFAKTLASSYGYATGGFTTAVATDAQKMTFVTGTWETVAGAALPAARSWLTGCGYGTTAGYSVSGWDGSVLKAEASKTVFSTDTTAAQASANTTVARRMLRSGHNGADRGYIVGGYAGGISDVMDKITFATDTTSNVSDIPAGASGPAGVSDGTYVYSIGDGTDTIRIPLATDSASVYATANIDESASYSTLSFPAIAGIFIDSNDYFKITFATGVGAAYSNGPVNTHSFGMGVGDGLGAGWIVGSVDEGGTSYDSADLLNPATETFSADGVAALVTAKSYAAWFNNGAY
jgi:hypothetical protein